MVNTTHRPLPSLSTLGDHSLVEVLELALLRRLLALGRSLSVGGLVLDGVEVLDEVGHVVVVVCLALDKLAIRGSGDVGGRGAEVDGVVGRDEIIRPRSPLAPVHVSDAVGI